jgi:phospholipid transport system substrate-binding protein
MLVSVLAVLGAASFAEADNSAPADVVNHLNASIIGVLQEAEELGYQGRLARLAPVLDETFDLSYMAHKAVGRQWRELSEEDQQRWRATFEELTSANYAGRFDSYSGQTFEMLGSEPGAKETVLVRTRLVNPAGEDVELSYRLRETEAGWKIIDVYLKGTVSELALRRSEYSSVLKRDGFEALLTSLNRKIDDLAAGGVKR